MSARHSRLAAAMAAAWEAEVVSAQRLSLFADLMVDPSVKARLLVLAAFCRAHGSRILARLAALGRGPLPVPPEPELDATEARDLRRAIERHIRHGRVAIRRYERMAELARNQADLSSAWVCELNRGEEQDLLNELTRLLDHEGLAAPTIPFDPQTPP